MNRLIGKFPIGFRGGAEMPVGAQFLHFGVGRVPSDYEPSKRAFCVWALIDPDAPKVHVRYEVVPTGDDIADLLALGAIHRGTVIVDDGTLVWHLFEVPTKEDGNG